MPVNACDRFGVHSLDFDPFRGQLRGLGLDDFRDQKMLVAGYGIHRSPFGKQQFFGMQSVHANIGLKRMRLQLRQSH